MAGSAIGHFPYYFFGIGFFNPGIIEHISVAPFADGIYPNRAIFSLGKAFLAIFAITHPDNFRQNGLVILLVVFGYVPGVKVFIRSNNSNAPLLAVKGGRSIPVAVRMGIIGDIIKDIITLRKGNYFII